MRLFNEKILQKYSFRDVAIVIIFIVLPCIACIPFIIFCDTNTWQYNADFKTYQSDFITVEDYLVNQYSSSEICFSIVGEALYDPIKEEFISIPDDIALSLRRIVEYGFPSKHAKLEYILIYKNEIIFSGETSPYALVYSPNGYPSYFGERSVRVKRVSGDWYHVVVG